MALINCPECGKQISDKAPACPNCGYPLELHIRQEREKAMDEARKEKETNAELLAHSSIENATEDVTLSVKEDVSDFDIASRRNIRSFQVDASQCPWLCVGCKAVLYDTSLSPIGGKKRQWEIQSAQQVGETLWITFWENNPLQKYKVPKIRIIAPANKEVYTEEEQKVFVQAIKQKFLLAKSEEEASAEERPANPQPPNEVACPYCGSTSVQLIKKGFSFGKAAVGGLLLGPVGLVGGTIGSNDVQRICLNCGKKF